MNLKKIKEFLKSSPLFTISSPNSPATRIVCTLIPIPIWFSNGHVVPRFIVTPLFSVIFVFSEFMFRTALNFISNGINPQRVPAILLTLVIGCLLRPVIYPAVLTPKFGVLLWKIQILPIIPSNLTNWLSFKFF
jgi:hypothetical protein